MTVKLLFNPSSLGPDFLCHLPSLPPSFSVWFIEGFLGQTWNGKAAKSSEISQLGALTAAAMGQPGSSKAQLKCAFPLENIEEKRLAEESYFWKIAVCF